MLLKIFSDFHETIEARAVDSEKWGFAGYSWTATASPFEPGFKPYPRSTEPESTPLDTRLEPSGIKEAPELWDLNPFGLESRRTSSRTSTNEVY